MAERSSSAARVRAARAQVALDRRVGRESADWILALARTRLAGPRTRTTALTGDAETTVVIDPDLETPSADAPVRELLSLADPSWTSADSADDPDGPEVRLEDWSQLYESSREHLLTVARTALGKEQDLAEDVVQEVFQRLIKNPPTAIEDLGKFLETVIRNQAYSVSRSEQRKAKWPVSRESSSDAVSSIPAVDDQIIFQLTLSKALAQLTPRERSMVDLVDIRGFTMATAAAQLGISIGSAKAVRFRGLQRLRQDLGVAGLLAQSQANRR